MIEAPATAPHSRTRRLRVLSNTQQTTDIFVLRFERRHEAFEPGQYLVLGLPGEPHRREYSIYSAPQDDYFEILYRRIPEGYLSMRLAALRPGDSIVAEGPEGSFTLPHACTQPESSCSLLLIATGTGIAPFHSFARAYPNLSCQVIHGVRTCAERADATAYGGNYIDCVSRETGGSYHGRLSSYLTEHLFAQPPSPAVSPRTHCFLCGNCDMIYEVYALLQSYGVSLDRVHTEVYF